jgi:DNA segregation ATPase FtsK/SpoIIIE, S-DNA-T family
VNAVASRRARVNRAAALHRQAASIAAAAEAALAGAAQQPEQIGHPEQTEQPGQAEQRELAERLRALTPRLAPGWLGASLRPLASMSGEQVAATGLTGGQYGPAFVRVGTARPLDDATFPVLIPLLGTGHLAFDADARDSRVAGAVRALLLRLLAATPPGSLLVRAVDAAAAGSTFEAFSPLAEAGLMPPPVTDRDGLRTVLDEAEGWVRPDRSPTPTTRNRTLLLVVASLPQLTEPGDLHRLAALAQAGPAAGLHIVIAGWPPPPLTEETTHRLLPLSTQVWLRNPYALVGDPPGASFGEESTNGLSCPVYLDEDPPAGVVVEVCREIAGQAAANHRLTLGDVLPDPAEGVWESDSAEELATTVGIAGDMPVMLRFNDQTPHWMVGGRSGAGKTAFLINVLYGLSIRYGPDELALYLLDLREGASFADFTPGGRDPSWLPHVHAVGVAPDREYGLAVLRELDAEMTRRSQAYEAAGVTRFVDLRAGGHTQLPRILCLIDEFQVLLAGTDRIATEAGGLLESVARKGRSYGIHLILCSQTVRDAAARGGGNTRRDSLFGQFPVRIALPGGGDVLEPTNYSAAALPLGTAVVNTAGGLGGPRGATRGHEKLVQFPDPHADQATLSELRLELWQRRPVEADPPVVFEGEAHHHLADDPVFQGLKAGGERRSMLIGRTIDVRLSTATFPVDTTPGRHLAVLGPSEVGADVVDAAARSLAAQHEPGTVSFLVASLVVAANPVARRLVADLRAAGHPTTTTDAARLAEDLDPTRPGYLVGFGMEAAGGRPYDRFRALVRDGPTHGAHLIGWWRGLSRFTDQTGGTAGREDVAGLVFLNLPAGDVDLLVGKPMEWRPRPNRALFYDRHTGRTTAIVPFTRAVS